MAKSRRLVIACDGTWLNSDDGFVRDSFLPWKTAGHLETPSNVTRLCRALLPEDAAGVQQLIYYQAGVGSQDNWYSFFLGGYLGEGFSENVREAYAFLCNNYVDGDEIFLTGFSRGAFTARTIADLVGRIGLLTMKGLGDFYAIFKDFENQETKGYINPYHVSFAKTSPPLTFNDPGYLSALIDQGLTRPNIPIKAVAVFETVGTLGVPNLTILPARHTHEYSFVNTAVAANVSHAFQALALDEHRAPFSPTIWESPPPSSPSSLLTLRQSWFPGVHATVGASSPDQGLGNATLAWILDALAPLGLAFDTPYITSLFTDVAASEQPPYHGWALGAITSNDSPLNLLTGVRTRTPGAYHAVDSQTGAELPRLLVGTHETVHPTVRVRVDMHGRGVGKALTYDPPALKGWTLYAPGEAFKGDAGSRPWPESAEGRFKWVKKQKGEPVICLLEEEIGDGGFQAMLLGRWPEARALVGKSLVSRE